MKEEEPIFFKDEAGFRDWLEKNHNKATELWVGFYKVDSGKLNMTWSQSVDQALCFGWIDGIRKSIDAESYKMRFTPRKEGSNWSKINIAKVAALEKAGLMRAAGRKAFEKRLEKKSGVYSFEQEEVAFSKEQIKEFKKHPKAWENFHKFPLSYRTPATWWVISAKQEATRKKRLEQLIEDSGNGEKIKSLRR